MNTAGFAVWLTAIMAVDSGPKVRVLTAWLLIGLPCDRAAQVTDSMTRVNCQLFMHRSALFAHENCAIETPRDCYRILSARPALDAVIAIKCQSLNVSAQSKVDLNVIKQ